MIIEKIIKHIGKTILLPSTGTKVLRLSSSGKCTRELAYAYHGFPQSNPMQAKTKFLLDDGDMHHADIRQRIHAAGIELTHEEFPVSLSILPNLKIPGHIDGLINPDSARPKLFEFKSSNHFAFQRFMKNGIAKSKEYLLQINSYLAALHESGFPEINEAIAVYKNKDTSELAEDIVKFDPSVIEQVSAKFLNILGTTPDKLPNRDYGPDDNGLLAWQCSFCPHLTLCWGATEPAVAGRRKGLKIFQKKT